MMELEKKDLQISRSDQDDQSTLKVTEDNEILSDSNIKTVPMIVVSDNSDSSNKQIKVEENNDPMIQPKNNPINDQDGKKNDPNHLQVDYSDNINDLEKNDYHQKPVMSIHNEESTETIIFNQNVSEKESEDTTKNTETSLKTDNVSQNKTEEKLVSSDFVNETISNDTNVASQENSQENLENEEKNHVDNIKLADKKVQTTDNISNDNPEEIKDEEFSSNFAEIGESAIEEEIAQRGFFSGFCAVL
ncbi:hypothetical protein EDEG_02898 [Edhazardia aedis USNM 41457]|uniref:Uncharacterized protein n=1 Tax=Edhazardia aedis (strain USNM 41457) TaxID=1003232 RepID=J9D5A5_EDHAE|nr:hypothetical protein EDEG_02898 [Edhazardia aedis USNM 41457]|eukprot:EJW02714.1 hypothetical protein EDEG_02898 [Edhazardia aedis USNM 41457]